MTDLAEGKLLHILQHACGLDQFGRGTFYRNHFVTGEGSLDHPTCMDAVRSGLMNRQMGGRLTGGDDVFFVTDKGKQFIRDHSPPVTPAQRNKDRYSRYLDLSDVMPDLTFKDFLLREKEFRRD